MIAYLNGKLAHKDPAYVIIECNGVGYEVKISLNTYSKIGKHELLKLHTYLMVKEDSQTLFGFVEPAEETFRFLCYGFKERCEDINLFAQGLVLGARRQVFVHRLGAHFWHQIETAAFVDQFADIAVFVA